MNTEALSSLVAAVLGGGGVVAVTGYLKDRQSQKFTEEQMRQSNALEKDDRRIVASEKAMHSMERWNSRLEEKVLEVQKKLDKAEETNAVLREENAALRERVAQLDARVVNLQNQCEALREEIKKISI